MKISATHVKQVADEGYAIIENFLEPKWLAAAQDALWDIYPRPADYFASPGDYEKLGASQFSGLHLFPFPSWALNRLAVYPDLVDAAERICGTKDLDLYQVELWAKYSGAVSYWQPHHFDYGKPYARRSENARVRTYR